MGQLQLSMKSWNVITRYSYSQVKKNIIQISIKKEKEWVIFFIIFALFIIATLEISFQIFNTLALGKVGVLQSNVRSNMLEIITTLLPIPHPSGGLTEDFQASSWSVTKHKYTGVWAA